MSDMLKTFVTRAECGPVRMIAYGLAITGIGLVVTAVAEYVAALDMVIAEASTTLLAATATIGLSLLASKGLQLRY